jgi:hypothetical protein
MTTPFADDTNADVKRRQIEDWRSMTSLEKAALISGLSRAVFDLAMAGVRQRYPQASPREHAIRLAVLTLGRDLAKQAYPEIEQLEP